MKLAVPMERRKKYFDSILLAGNFDSFISLKFHDMKKL